MARYCRATASLLEGGWSVVRLWESEVLADVEGCMDRILDSRRVPDLAVAPAKTFAEFFAGIGLMRCALEKQGWTAAFANDIDSKKLDMYRAHFGAGFDLADIHELSPEAVPSES